MKTLFFSKVKKYLKDVWIGISISTQNYLEGKTNQGKF